MTDVWKENGITENYEYAMLTNKIYKTWAGMKTSEYKDFKGNGTENRKGLFMGKLYDKIKDYNIPIIGVNRKYINKSLKELEHLLNID